MPAYQEQLMEFAPRLIAILLVLFAFWLASLFVEKIVLRSASRTGLNKEALELIGAATKTGFLLLAGIIVLAILGIDLTTLVAGLGLTGLILGIALREIVVNILAGILLIVDRPFRKNDFIHVAGVEGTVTAIDLRYTTLQGEDRKILIPNSMLLTNAVTIIKTPKPWPAP